MVPADAELRATLLREMHATRLANHFGVRKTHDAVSRCYWWPQWYTHVEAYVKECDACQRNKTSTHALAGLLQPLRIRDMPWQFVSMDFITQLPKTRRGHDATLNSLFNV